MLITVTVISILVISVAVWLANWILPFTVCPICAGVFLTWVGLASAHFLGYEIALIVPALLMGGSVVGIAYQLEKKFYGAPAGAPMLWKAFFIPAGFVAAYAVLEQRWVMFLLAMAFLFLISLALLFPRGESADNIEKKMKDCC